MIGYAFIVLLLTVERKAKRLDEILRNYRPPILVALDRKNSKWNFRNGRMIQSEDSLGTLILFKAYFEHFARVNQLINGGSANSGNYNSLD